MLGFAQKLFKENNKIAPFSPILKKKKTKFSWSFLERLLEQKALSSIDLVIAETLLSSPQCVSLENVIQNSEAIAIFICHLCLAYRKGHLCVKIADNSTIPSPKMLWKDPDASLSEEDLEEICLLVSKGLQIFPKELFSTELEPDPSRPFHLSNSYLYLQKYWIYESDFVASIKKIEMAKPLFNPNVALVEAEVQKMIDERKLLPEQANAILVGCQSNLTIIAGGPGTGKTYTAGHLIRIFLSTHPEDMKNSCKIVLTAPTGKAASNLQKSLLNSFKDNSMTQQLDSKTLHALLLPFKSQNKGFNYLSANLIVVDECSMIDAKMMAKLFSSVKPGSKIILLGDRFQLPPVEAGSIFSDLLIAKIEKNAKNIVELKQCMRADIQSLISFSKNVNEGNLEAIQIALKNDSKDYPISKFILDPSQISQENQKKIVDFVIQKYEKILESSSTYTEILQALNTFRLLSPLKKGFFGVDEMNALILKNILRKWSAHRELIIPIIITKNDYKLQLFNGETGILIKKNIHSESLEKGDVIMVFNKELLKIPALIVKEFEFAYCISIHKSQGSEFDEVAVLVPQGSEFFGREVLYTAITRAKKKVVLIYDEQALIKTVSHQNERISGVGFSLE